jgi:hypothetical protein
MRRGEKGAAVTKLQKALLSLGYHLPRWGADGDLGAETIDTLALFLHDHGMPVAEDADEVTDEQQALVYNILAQRKGAPSGPKVGDDFYDIRSNASSKHVRDRRAWTKITGITLHQTACVLGEKPARWGTVGAHIGITRAGKVIWMHDFDRVVIHGNGFNSSTIGIEMDGTYAGVEGDDKTFWLPKDDPKRKAQSPTPELIKAAKATVRWICGEVERHGGDVQMLVAHRQASKDRQSDPGSALWQNVAMPLHTELGLNDGGPGYKIGDGFAIPERWDPSRSGVKY